MTNPLLKVNELPPFDQIEAGHVRPAIDNLLAECRSGIQKLLNDGAQTWVSLVQPRDELEDKLNQAWSPVSHMNSVVNTEDLRQVYNECLPRLSEYSTEMGQNLQLFTAYKSISEAPAYDDLSVAQRKVVENALREFRLSGIELSPESKERFAEISKRLSELGSQFSDNLLDATGAWSKSILDIENLSGLPESALGLARQTAEQRGKQGYMLTLDMPSYLSVMTYCNDSDLRREVYEAYLTRASEIGPGEGKWDNSQLMLDILSLRKEQAGLLGFQNFAENSLAMKMADSTDQVLAFLEELAAKSKPVAAVEYKEMCEFARKEYGISELNPWDISFYAEKLKKAKYDISDEELRPYFPAPRVTEGMFEVVRRLYDIEIVQVTDVNKWHEDVRTFNILKDGAVIARFYLDFYARSKKKGGAWMDECRVRRRRVDGSLQLPVAYLTCNFYSTTGR